MAVNNNYKQVTKSKEQDGQANEVLKSIQSQLNNFCKEEKPFLDNRLSLNSLANTLGVPSYKLSQAINRCEGKSFIDYINCKRIEEAKSLLTYRSYNHYSIEGIAWEVGFNSKVSFISAFKKIEGVTPNVYRKSVQNQQTKEN